MPKGATKEVIDYKLSRYACYLIVQNASPVRHKSVALIPKIVAEHLSVSDKIAEYNVSRFFEAVNKKR